MTCYVYLLSSYGEHGSVGVEATLDRSLLPMMLVRRHAAVMRRGTSGWSDDYLARVKEALAAEAQGLAAALAKPDVELAVLDDDPFGLGSDPVNLGEGWGGSQLHVVELEG